MEDLEARARSCNADEIVILLMDGPDTYDLGYDSFHRCIEHLTASFGSPLTQKKSCYVWRDLQLTHQPQKPAQVQRRRLLSTLVGPGDVWKALFYSVENLPVTRFPSNSDIHFRMSCDRAVFRRRPHQEVVCEVQRFDCSSQPRFKVCAKWMPKRGPPSSQWFDVVAALSAQCAGPVAMQDSTTLFIDSRNRDMVLYPTPSEYSISFEKPFRLVYGFEILDAAIPASTYNVDAFNNTLAFTRLSVNDLDVTSVYMDLRWIADYVTVAAYLENGTDAMVVSPDHWSQLPPELAVPLTLPPSDGSQWNVVVVRSEVVVPAIYDNSRGHYSNNSDFVLVPPTFALAADAYPDVAQDVADGRIVVNVSNDGGMTVLKYEVRWVASQDTLAFLRDLSAFSIEMQTSIVRFEPANYDINTFMVQLASALSPYQISVGSSTAGTVEMASRYLFASANDFFFDMSRSRCQTLLGFDTQSHVGDSGNYQSLPWLEGQQYLFRATYDALSRRYKLIPPGIVNMAGIRYMLLRCPEIEQHSNTFSFMQTSPGIAILKLASTNDVTHLRFDFVNLLRKPFHPIGKLSRLTFRFELPDGSLYDFKYVNHQLLMSIRYYIPERADRGNSDQYVLNPQYDPDFHKYFIKYMPSRSLSFRPVEEDESEEEDDSEGDNM